MLRITRSALAAICKHAEETGDEECCGGLSSPAAGGVVDEAHRCANIQNKLHARNPIEHPRTAKDAYYIDPLELLKTQESVDALGRSLAGIYHSHPNEESYFSAEDKRRALWDDDQPMWPDAHYLIASVKNGKVAYVKSFAWDPGKKDFLEEPVEVV